MGRPVRFGGMHDEYSLEMYKKMTQNNPDVFVEEPKPKPKEKPKLKPKEKPKKKLTLKQLQKLANSKKISIYKKNSKTPLTITGLKSRLTKNKVKYL